MGASSGPKADGGKAITNQIAKLVAVLIGKLTGAVGERLELRPESRLQWKHPEKVAGIGRAESVHCEAGCGLTPAHDLRGRGAV